MEKFLVLPELRLDAVDLAVVAQLAQVAIVPVQELEQRARPAAAAGAAVAAGWVCRSRRPSLHIAAAGSNCESVASSAATSPS